MSRCYIKCNYVGNDPILFGGGMREESTRRAVCSRVFGKYDGKCRDGLLDRLVVPDLRRCPGSASGIITFPGGPD